MKSRRFIQADVFSAVPTKGNGLAVIVEAEGLSDDDLQTFAAWTNEDVPEAIIPDGSATQGPPGTWAVDGAGQDIWGASDEFHYLYDDVILSGDFALACHLVSLSGSPSTWAKAGLMFVQYQVRGGSVEGSIPFGCGT